MTPHRLTPIFTARAKVYWCPTCAAFECTGTAAAPAPTLTEGKVKRARRRFADGTTGNYVILTPAGYVKHRCRHFYDRRREPDDKQQYIRHKKMYSINSETTPHLRDAKRWKTRQAAHRANEKLSGRVINRPADCSPDQAQCLPLFSQP